MANEEKTGQQQQQGPLEEPAAAAAAAAVADTFKAREDDDEPDEWDKRINKTGCADENANLLSCHFEKKDWRLCTEEMDKFRECWKVHGNDKRTCMTEDVDTKP